MKKGEVLNAGFRTAVAAAVFVAGGMAARADVDLPSKFSNMGSVANTRHNLSQRPLPSGGNVSAAIMDPYRNDYGGVCVYCHTPHGANADVKLPLWNRTIKQTTYAIYASQTMTQAIAQPGVNSLACLSCHDGQVAVDSIINMPGSGRYNPGQATGENSGFLSTWTNPGGTGPFVHLRMTECMACHASNAGIVGAGATDFKAYLIGTDLRDDHPVGVRYPASPADLAFRELTGTQGNVKFFDENSNGRPDKQEVRVFNSGDGYQVECSSCHDPHGVPSAGSMSKFNPSFLRIASAGSAICLACHVK